MGKDGEAYNRWHIGHTYAHCSERWHYIEFDQTLGRPNVSTDSIALSFEYQDSADGSFVWWRDSTWQGTDTTDVHMTGKADYTIDTDSLIFYYKTTGKIDSISIYTCKDTTQVGGGGYNYLPASKWPDSLVYGSGTDRTSATAAYIKIALSERIHAGERVAITFHNVLADDNDYVKMYYCALKGTRYGMNR